MISSVLDNDQDHATCHVVGVMTFISEPIANLNAFILSAPLRARAVLCIIAESMGTQGRDRLWVGCYMGVIAGGTEVCQATIRIQENLQP